MTEKTQMGVVVAAVLAVTSIGSHLVARGLGIRTQAVTLLHFGNTNTPGTAVAAGSSLAYFGISWQEVSTTLGVKVNGWAVPGGSVHELEILQREAPSAQYTFLGLSTFDLNENSVSDYRADVVPFVNEVAS